MVLIASTDDLFTYLHERLCNSRPLVAVPDLWVDIDMGLVLGQRRLGLCIGLPFDQWANIFASTLEPSTSKLGQAHAQFMSWFLADLAAGGEGRQVSITQTLLLMILALGWSS